MICEFGACGGGATTFGPGTGAALDPNNKFQYTVGSITELLGFGVAYANWGDPNERLFGTHYCGPGGGGSVGPGLDSACAAHDACYQQHGNLTPGDNWNPLNTFNGRGHDIQACNQTLCDATAKIPGSGASLVRSYFQQTGIYGCHP